MNKATKAVVGVPLLLIAADAVWLLYIMLSAATRGAWLHAALYASSAGMILVNVPAAYRGLRYQAQPAAWALPRFYAMAALTFVLFIVSR